MAHLFSNIEDLRAVVGGAVNNDDAIFASIAPYIAESDEKHLVPWFGDALWAKVLTPPVGEPSQLTVFRILAKRASGFLAISVYDGIGDVQRTEKGRMRNELAPFRYQDERSDLQVLESGYQAFEKALVFLNDNVHVLTDWATTEGYQKHRSLFLNNSVDMRWYYGKGINRWVYEQLRPIIEDIEGGAFPANLPRAFLADLLAKRNAKTAVNIEKEVIRLLSKAVAHFAVGEAMTKGFAKLDGKGNVVMSQTKDDDGKSATANNPQGVAYTVAWHDLWANRHMVAVKDYIILNRSTLSLAFAVADGGTNTDADAWDTRTFEVKFPDLEPPVSYVDRKFVRF